MTHLQQDPFATFEYRGLRDATREVCRQLTHEPIELVDACTTEKSGVMMTPGMSDVDKYDMYVALTEVYERPIVFNLDYAR